MRQWMAGLLPVLLLGVFLGIFFLYGPIGVFQDTFPPVEELVLEWVELPAPNQMVVHVVNSGPDPVTIAQVMVDDALWQFHTQPASKTLPRLGRMRILIPYPWVDGEMHEVTLLTSTGLTFSRLIEVATQSPFLGWTYLWTFSLFGVYAAVIPVFLGLLWYPFLRGIHRNWLSFFLSLTVGFLFYLALDTLDEAFEVASQVPGPYQGVGLVGIGVVATLLSLLFFSGRGQGIGRDRSQERAWIAFMIALGIGFHNLGEGLAIGSAYALGEIALGTFLIVGFTLHNLTEGLAIVAPIAADRPPLSRLVALGALAGLPTIVGTLIGGFSYSPIWATLFLAIGTGAIIQVIYEIVKLFSRRAEGALANAYTLTGFLLGLAVMYGTGLLVVT